MEIRNNNALDLGGDDQEDITVRAVSKKPGDTVAYALDFSFRLLTLIVRS